VCDEAFPRDAGGHGFDIRAIRPPTLPEWTARLRVAVTLNAGAQIVSRAPVLRQ